MASSGSRGAASTLLLSLTLAACGTSDKLVGRYRTATCQTVRQASNEPAKPLPADFVLGEAGPAPCETIIPTASASAISIAAPPGSSSTKTGTDLPERALAAYIPALARMTGSVDKLRAAIAAPLAAAQAGAPSIDDRTVFKRVLVVSTRLEGGFNSVDRLEHTDILIRPYGARFTEWDILATSTTTVDAGSVTLTRGRTTTQTLSAAAPAGAPVTASASVGGTQTDSRAEQFNARAVVPNTSATVDGQGNLRITRRGGFGIDLTDNAVIRVTMRYTGEPGPDDAGPANPDFQPRFSGMFFDQAGKRLEPGKVTLTPKAAFTVPNGRSVMADVFLNYTLRHVSSGGDTYEERDDDTLDRTTGPVRRRTTLISGDDATSAEYAVQVGADGGKRISVGRNGRSSDLCFSSLLEAQGFIDYIKSAAGSPLRTVGGYAMGIFRIETRSPLPVPLTRSEAQELALHLGC